MVALVTPFAPDGSPDEATFVSLCERQIEAGSKALVPCGTTGEAPTLTHAEQSRLIALAVRTARGRVPVIAGAGSNCTATTIAMVAEAKRLGADGVLCVVPYYNRPSQEGLYRHFAAIDGSTTLPILLYDVPQRTGVALDLDTIARLADLPNIIGLKDASGDLGRARRLRALLDPSFLRLGGDDTLIAPLLGMGGHGCISVCANLVPALCAALHENWRNREIERVEFLLRDLAPLCQALALETNPVPVKWAMEQLGLMTGGLRLPLLPLEQRHHAAVREALGPILVQERFTLTANRSAA